MKHHCKVKNVSPETHTIGLQPMDLLTSNIADLFFFCFFERCGGHPEGDEGEGRGAERLARHYAVPHTQQPGSHRRQGHHPASAGHHLHPRPGQAHRQPVLAAHLGLPRQVRTTGGHCFSTVCYCREVKLRGSCFATLQLCR